jgi:hypothetical protein
MNTPQTDTKTLLEAEVAAIHGIEAAAQAAVDAELAALPESIDLDTLTIDQLLSHSARLHAIGCDESQSFADREAAFSLGFACAYEAHYRRMEE